MDIISQIENNHAYKDVREKMKNFVIAAWKRPVLYGDITGYTLEQVANCSGGFNNMEDFTNYIMNKEENHNTRLVLYMITHVLNCRISIRHLGNGFVKCDNIPRDTALVDGNTFTIDIIIDSHTGRYLWN